MKQTTSAAQFQSLMRERRKARSPRDKQPKVSRRWLEKNCIRKRGNSVFVMVDERDILP